MLREAEAHYPVARLLLDAGGSWRWGGTGERFEWESVGSLARDCMVAGGLTPSNVGAAVVAMHPWAVDVSSGVETAGKKDAALIQSFIMEVRRRDSHES
jgi:phosphoribosylanthranilate isomerase